MKRNYNFLLILVLLVIMIGFAGCSDSSSGDDDTYTVTYDGNGNTGGTVPTGSNNYEQGTTVTVLDNTGSLLRIPAAGTGEAFKFDGWNTQADGNGTDYAASATFSMSTANVTLYVKWGAFVLRDTGPAGGLIFYDKGSYSDSWRYLEAAPSDQTSQAWIAGGATQTTLNGNTLTAIGTGQANSDFIIAQTDHTGSAAQVCLDYVDGIYSDWFLPSQDELAKIYINLRSGTDENGVNLIQQLAGLLMTSIGLHLRGLQTSRGPST